MSGRPDFDDSMQPGDEYVDPLCDCDECGGDMTGLVATG